MKETIMKMEGTTMMGSTIMMETTIMMRSNKIIMRSE
jgi:hypothetical protein